MHDQSTSINDLKKLIENFMNERDWAQFHSPKNLSMALSAEAAELMEHFLWVESSQSHTVFEKKREEIENEVADITLFVLQFCITNKIDLSRALKHKMALNAQKYPVEKCKGKAVKYTEL